MLSLGSNMGDRAANLRRARESLDREEGLALLTASPIYQTQPVGVTGTQVDFLNQIVVISTRLTPEQMLNICQDIEERLGRLRSHRAGLSRNIDLDIIALGGLIRRDAPPLLPHPRYTRRKFVLVPLAAVLPDFSDPLTGLGVQQLLAACADSSKIELYSDEPAMVL